MKELKYRSDSHANQNLKPLAHGFSQGVSADKPGSEFTKTFPQLRVPDNERPFPTHQHHKK